MIYDTCSWRPLYVETQHGIRTLWRRDSVWVSYAATMEAEVDAIDKQEAQGYCHRRGGHTCGEAANGSVAASTKAGIAKETTLLRCGAEWFVCCGVEAKAMWKVVAILE